MRALVIAWLLLTNPVEPVRVDCVGQAPLPGDVVTAMRCGGLDGFFVPSEFFRRSGGLAESFRLRPFLEEKVLHLTASLDLVGTATAALGRALTQCERDKKELALQWSLEREEHRGCTASLLEASERASSLWPLVGMGIGGIALGALTCVGTTRAVQ